MEHSKDKFCPGLYTNYLHLNGWLILTRYKVMSFFELKFDLVTSSEIICMLLPLTLCQIKIFTFLFHRNDIGDLLQLLSNNLFIFYSNKAKARGNEILEKFVRKTNRFVLLFVVLEILPMTVWVGLPMISGGNSFSNTTIINKFLPGWYPWDYSQYPGYHFAFLYETTMACFNSFYQVSSNALFYQLTLMLCGHTAVLAESFGNLEEVYNTENILEEMKISYQNNKIVLKSSLLALINKDEEISLSLKMYVENHQNILRLSRKLNKVYSVLIGADILLCLFLICLILFLLTSVPEKQSLTDIVKSISFLGSAGCKIFAVCWLGSELEKMSFLLKNGVFHSGWPARPVRLNTSLPTVLVVASRPLTLSAGNTYAANLELFASTMQFAYSFYTLLVNVQKG